MAYSYETPSQEFFDEIKEKSIKIWGTYDDTYGYATEKIERVESIENFKDNWSSIVGMFDNSNIAILKASLSEDSKVKLTNLIG
jgi:hypothetical protein